MNNIELQIQELRNKINELEASLKNDKFDYPICKRHKIDDVVVLFDDLTKGTVLLQGKSIREEGSHGDSWHLHTDTEVWEDYPYDKERGLYHKQMVYCWDNDDYTYGTEVRFYDAINKCTFYYDGASYGTDFDNYSATMPDFMLEAHKTLKD